MEDFFNEIELEREFVRWYGHVHKDSKRTNSLWTYTYAKETIQYKCVERPWPLPIKIVETSRKKGQPDDYYPINISIIDTFLRKYGIKIQDGIRYFVDGVPFFSTEGMEAQIKDRFKEHPYSPIRVEIFYDYYFNISSNLENTFSRVYDIGLTKVPFYDGSSFFQKVRQTNNIRALQKYIKKSDGASPGFFHYEIYANKIGYYDHMGQEDMNCIFYSSLDLKDLESDNECYGLGFAIAELFLEKQNIDIITGIINQKIEVSHLYIASDYYAICFQVDSGIKPIPRELKDW